MLLLADQSGCMATSVVYASIFAAVLASPPALRTRPVVFDTSVLDLMKDLADPVEVLFGVQVDGGTDINAGLAYCAGRIEDPGRTHLAMITDLLEGGDAAAMLSRAAALVQHGVNLVVLLAPNDDGRPSPSRGAREGDRFPGRPSLRLHARAIPRHDGDGATPRRSAWLGCPK